MNLKKVASLLKEASEEIKRLKEENKKLREQIESMDKTASVEDADYMIGFGNVANDEFSNVQENPKDLFLKYFS